MSLYVPIAVFPKVDEGEVGVGYDVGKSVCGGVGSDVGEVAFDV